MERKRQESDIASSSWEGSRSREYPCRSTFCQHTSFNSKDQVSQYIVMYLSPLQMRMFLWGRLLMLLMYLLSLRMRLIVATIQREGDSTSRMFLLSWSIPYTSTPELRGSMPITSTRKLDTSFTSARLLQAKIMTFSRTATKMNQPSQYKIGMSSLKEASLVEWYPSLRGKSFMSCREKVLTQKVPASLSWLERISSSEWPRQAIDWIQICSGRERICNPRSDADNRNTCSLQHPPRNPLNYPKNNTGWHT